MDHLNDSEETFCEGDLIGGISVSCNAVRTWRMRELVPWGNTDNVATVGYVH